MSGLGRIVSAYQVAKAAEDGLKKWLPSVLAETARQHDLDPVKVRTPRTWGVLEDVTTARPNQLPAVLVDSPGILGDPRRAGGGLYSVEYEVHGYADVRGNTADDTAQLVAIYCAAIRAAWLQHPSLDGFARSARWLDEDLQPDLADKARTLREGFVAVAFEIPDVLDIHAGPVEPPPDPLTEDPEDPIAETATVQFQRQE